MTLDDAILQTISYSNHFNFPLTAEEIYLRLIGFHTTHTSLIKALNLLVRSGNLFQVDGYYYLPGRRSIISERRAQANNYAPKCELAQKYALILSKVPGVVALYLTGSLAVNNAKTNDDLDFMIITLPNRLWLTRLLVTIYCEALGIRRRPRRSFANNELCLNLYLTTNSLAIPKSKHSLYTAYELIQAIPLYDPIGTQSLLFAKNSWLSSYLPNFMMGRLDQKGSVLKRNSRVQLEKGSAAAERTVPKVLNFIDLLAFKLQHFYMHRKITREYITRDRAFFHPVSPGQDIMGALMDSSQK